MKSSNTKLWLRSSMQSLNTVIGNWPGRWISWPIPGDRLMMRECPCTTKTQEVLGFLTKPEGNRSGVRDPNTFLWMQYFTFSVFNANQSYASSVHHWPLPNQIRSSSSHLSSTTEVADKGDDRVMMWKTASPHLHVQSTMCSLPPPQQTVLTDINLVSIFMLGHLTSLFVQKKN